MTLFQVSARGGVLSVLRVDTLSIRCFFSSQSQGLFYELLVKSEFMQAQQLLSR